MVRLPLLLVAAALALAGVTGAAAQAQRPRIGLVLGGGGARGGAHIGVLEVLEQLRIPVDCISGTSMGALVGGAYAAGIAPAEMRTSIERTDWSRIFDDSAGREEVAIRRKELDDRFFSALEFGVGEGGLRYREGAVAGAKIKLFFNSLVRSDLGEKNIEDLQLPLTLIATDIGTGDRVAMRSGSLTTAMRASMSVPGAIAPVIREGHKLVDGGLVDNVPIQEVRDRCGAEAVIAVNVGSPLMKPEEVTGLVSVVGQMVNLLTEQNVSRSLALITPKDVYMRPELGDITAASFERQLEAAEIGRRTALANAESLRRYSVSQEEYEAWRNRTRLASTRPPRIDEVQVASTKYVNPGIIRDGITQQPGTELDVPKLDRDLINLYSAGDLQNIDYAIVTERDKTILRVTPVEKPLGPDYLRFGLNLYSDSRNEATFNVRALYRRTWMNSMGGEILAGVQIGSEKRAVAEFYQPVEPSQVFFVRAWLNAIGGNTPLYVNGQRLAEYRVDYYEGGIDAGARIGVWGQVRAGYTERRTDAKVDTGAALLPDVKETVSGFRGELRVDTQDFAFFPTKGFRIDGEVFDATHVSDNQEKYGAAQLRIGGAWTLGDVILVGAAEHGQSFHGKLPASAQFMLGGPRHLSAYAPGQFRGDDMSYGRAEIQYKLTRPIPLLGFSMIGGLQAEAGRIRTPSIDPAPRNWLSSFGVYLAANSVLGPVYVGYSDSKDSRGRLYFFIGTP